MLEIEMKFPVERYDEVVAKLAAWGCRAQPAEEEADHYFAAPDRDFAKTDEAVRLRRVGPRNIATYKGPKEPGPTKTRTEIEVSLEPGPQAADAFCAFLTHLRYRPVAVVRKTRTCYPFERDGFAMQACLDDVTKAGRFIEVEILAPEADRDRAQQTLLAVVAELGLGQAERRSYLEMVLAATAAIGGS